MGEGLDWTAPPGRLLWLYNAAGRSSMVSARLCTDLTTRGILLI
jgi:hypothetical protein